MDLSLGWPSHCHPDKKIKAVSWDILEHNLGLKCQPQGPGSIKDNNMSNKLLLHVYNMALRLWSSSWAQIEIKLQVNTGIINEIY